MTSITVPGAGSDADASWAEAVADALNLAGIITSADVNTSSATWADLTGLTFPCDSGKNYAFDLTLTYESSSTSGGPVVGFNHPGGTANMLIEYYGDTSATVSQTEAQNGTDGTGGGAGVASANTGGATYFIRARGRYQCTSSGTFAIRMKRNTAGTVTFHKGCRLSVVSD